MYIIVVGAGQVGFHLAKNLIAEGHEVSIVELDVKTCDMLVDVFGDRVIPGSGARLSVLSQAGAERADVLVAATGADEDNLVIAQLAKRLGVRRVIARVNNPSNVEIFHRLGIELTVSATRLIAELIDQEVAVEDMRTLLTFPSGDFEIVEVDVSDRTAWVNRQVREILWPDNTLLVSILRGGRVVVPKGRTVLRPGDRLLVLTPPEGAPKIRERLGAAPAARA
jgi:trk system potassium uptake protein TrkA